MADPMQDIRAAFFVECEELLEALQDGLAALDAGDTDPETVNTVFRAVHSIKGGAGAFGLEPLVAFAHRFETALDLLRGGDIDAGRDTVALFFRCGDLLADHVAAARDGADLAGGSGDAVEADLAALVGDAAAGEEADPGDFEVQAISLDGIDDAAGAPELPGPGGLPAPAPPEPADRRDETAPPAAWRIRFVPHAALYDSLNEPLLLLRALADLGRLDTTLSWREGAPGLDGYDPSAALLAFDMRLETPAGLAAVEEVFEFVEGLCDLEISAEPPAAADPAGGRAGSAPEDAAEGDAGARAAPPAEEPPASAGAATAGGASDAPRPDAAPAAGPAAAGAASRPAPASATVRVGLDRIDRLVNLVGELVINQAMLAQSVTDLGVPSNSPVSAGLDDFQQLTRSIQESVMMIRAQPVKSLFQRMGRIVREAATATGKDVRLVTEGETTEIDKTVIERLSDPLTHMIRNAVDHGLEPPDRRHAAGKPATGTLRLTAAHRSGRVVIGIADDGAGIDRRKVLATAVSKGLVPPDQALGDGEIDALLFTPGFSTASEVSNLSGRGVGMDVVKSAITSLGGKIGIASVPGEGTTFSISLPLTLAVLDGMVIDAAGETLVMPLNAIVETLKVEAEKLETVGPGRHVLRARDAYVPIFDLGAELGYRAGRTDFDGTTALLVGQDSEDRAAIVVDSIADQRQVVIKGLEENYGRIDGVAAATILGDGRIALILDPADLVGRAAAARGGEQKARAAG